MLIKWSWFLPFEDLEPMMQVLEENFPPLSLSYFPARPSLEDNNGGSEITPVGYDEYLHCPEEWILEALYGKEEMPPSLQEVERAFSKGSPPSKWRAPTEEEMPSKDWLQENQQELSPISLGSFHITGSHHSSPWKAKSSSSIHLKVDAARAFGSGYHETTQGCLLALEELTLRFGWRKAFDLGCGSGILSIALAKLRRLAGSPPQTLQDWSLQDLQPWTEGTPCLPHGTHYTQYRHLFLPKYRDHFSILASDIDQEAVHMALYNSQENRVYYPVFHQAGIPQGLLDQAKHSPQKRCHVLVANILLNPILDMARDMDTLLTPGGHLVLSGFLTKDVPQVLERFPGYRLHMEQTLNPWSVLWLEKP